MVLVPSRCVGNPLVVVTEHVIQPEVCDLLDK